MSEAEKVDLNSKEGLELYRHSAAHVMAAAVKALYPNTKFSIGPAIEDGFYYDFDADISFTPEMLVDIEAKMKEISKQKLPFERTEVTREEAEKRFTESGDVYKVEILKDIPAGEIVTLYTCGDFCDLCRGPHVPHTGYIKFFKLLSVAGAYFKGDENNKMLQRIYGTAFPDKKDLRAHIERLEEAKKRDHRIIGKELDLYSIQEEAGPGLVFWHPKGAMLRHLVEDFWKKEHFKRGYDLVNIPHVLKMDLWKKSGHLDFYSENMFSPMEVDNNKYIAKPMNCPGHILIYKSDLRSYRDLPLRWAELGTVYRYERSGVLHGMMRVRGFTQDDAHIFCTPQQVESEVKEVLELTGVMLKTFGFEFKVYLSTRPEKYVGTDENWAQATEALKLALENSDIAYEVDPGEGVFYGPKIDIKLIDALGRGWQGPTIQVDFNLPERFDVNYRDKEGKESQVVMIHRTVLGSMERFIGVLTEHYAGDFPLWLAPEQVRILAMSEIGQEAAKKFAKELKMQEIRVKNDTKEDKLGKKIRNAEKDKIPYVAVIGEKEAAEGKVNVRSRKTKEQTLMSMDDFVALLKKEVDLKA